LSVLVRPPPPGVSGMLSRTVIALIGPPVVFVHCTLCPVPVRWAYAWPDASKAALEYCVVGGAISETAAASPPSVPASAS
jgi:hypothetical protein